MLSHGDDIIVCSGKAYYGLKGSDGSELYERSIKDDGIGLASSIFEHKGNIVVVGTKGVSLHDVESGKLKASNKYKTSEMDDFQGDILVMKTAKADIAAFDLNDCSYREFKAKTDAQTWLSLTSEYVYVYESKKVKKVRTKG